MKKQGSVQRGRYEYDIEAGKQQAGNVLAEVYFHGRRDSLLSRRSAFRRVWSCLCVMALHAEAGLVSVLRHKAGRFFRI